MLHRAFGYLLTGEFYRPRSARDNAAITVPAVCTLNLAAPYPIGGRADAVHDARGSRRCSLVPPVHDVSALSWRSVHARDTFCALSRPAALSRMAINAAETNEELRELLGSPPYTAGPW